MTSAHPILPVPTAIGAVGLVSEPIGHGIGLRRFDFAAPESCALQVEGPATFCVAIYLEGIGSVALEGGAHLAIEPGTTVLFYAPRPSRGEKRIIGGRQLRCLDFRFDPALLGRFGIRDPASLAPAFTTDCSVREFLMLGRPTPQALSTIARDILSCRFEGLPRRLYLHGKALEVLATVIALSERPPAPPPRPRKADMQRIDEARALLDARYDEHWTITRLARAVGVNEKKLKTGFRTLLGSTVHGYLIQTRLAAATTMLEGGSSVTDAAMAAGYANPSHFAKLFRQRHGSSPGRWLRKAPD